MHAGRGGSTKPQETTAWMTPPDSSGHEFADSLLASSREQGDDSISEMDGLGTQWAGMGFTLTDAVGCCLSSLLLFPVDPLNDDTIKVGAVAPTLPLHTPRSPNTFALWGSTSSRGSTSTLDRDPLGLARTYRSTLPALSRQKSTILGLRRKDAPPLASATADDSNHHHASLTGAESAARKVVLLLHFPSFCFGLTATGKMVPLMGLHSTSSIPSNGSILMPFVAASAESAPMLSSDSTSTVRHSRMHFHAHDDIASEQRRSTSPSKTQSAWWRGLDTSSGGRCGCVITLRIVSIKFARWAAVGKATTMRPKC
eukprot:PhM_4_TR6725/c0_g1_i1/m.68576